MAVLGFYTRVQSGRFAAGFAVVEGGAISTSNVLSAPSVDDARSLSELYRMAHDLIGAYEPEKVAVLKYQNQNGKILGVARRAEGAVLAAAGHRDRRVVEWGNVLALRKPVGLEGNVPSDVTYEEITAMIDGAEDVPAEVGYAAAAALAATGT
jgi:Holliday junction resolvasome RuvABC endonuclease subunit